MKRQNKHFFYRISPEIVAVLINRAILQQDQIQTHIATLTVDTHY